MSNLHSAKQPNNGNGMKEIIHRILDIVEQFFPLIMMAALFLLPVIVLALVDILS